MTQKYHPYVFDLENRSFVGNFEEMYAQENIQGFDSWHEGDLRMLRKQIALTVLSNYSFSSVLELGCGKGNLTQFFKKTNNHVTAVDISKTAIERGKMSYPDINFICSPINDYVSLLDKRFNLTVIMGTLAYLEDWSSIIYKLADHTDYLLVGEFIPHNPIGFVKSSKDLIDTYQKHFNIETNIVLDKEHILLMGKLKK